MAIPGGESLEPVGKVRIGEKNGKFAKSLNYFRANEPLFAELCPGQPSELDIVLVESGDEPAWNSGLEWWVNKAGSEKPTLACYTKDGGTDPIALRVEAYLDPTDTVRGEKRGSNRIPISCPFRECAHFKAKQQCKPTARLNFYIASDPKKRPWRLDTKSWNSIEAIEKALAGRESLDGTRWKLSVAFESKGEKRFPVLGLEEHVVINDEKDITKADALVALTKANELAIGHAHSAPQVQRKALADYLDVTSPGWKQNAGIVARIQEIGVDQAIVNILKREHE